MPNKDALHVLLTKVKQCNICEDSLPLGARPVLQISSLSRILIAGQAPGSKVHETGIPFDDPSGKRLREWLGVSEKQFYDPDLFAILPMGFCFPGTGKSGDLAPRPECEPTWRSLLMDHLENIELTIVLGQYAQKYYFGSSKVTQLVSSWKEYWPHQVPLPHPSPRNNIWLRRNPWFETDVIPSLQERVKSILKED